MKYGNLTVIEEGEPTYRTVNSSTRGTYQAKQRMYKCVCDCGATCVKLRTEVISGHTKSCGCQRMKAMTKKTHGMSKGHKLYRVWASQKTRCRNPKDLNYDKYGERGIKFSKKFDEFTDWLKYVLSLDDAEKETYTLDRINNNKGYKEGNMRWTSHSVQQANRNKCVKNKSGYKGAHYHKQNDNYVARVQYEGVGYHIGVYATAKKAGKAYNKFVKEKGFPHSLNKF